MAPQNDPRIGIIRVKMNTATYSLVAKNIVEPCGLKLRMEPSQGKPANVNKLREISPSEVEAVACCPLE